MTLDRVMLAMDVVDTLRHQQSLVEAELDDDRRQREFVTRVQAIYESQGIEVPESVIEEGVRALRENRFVYVPPPRTFAVRVAEVYAERGKWSRRAAIVLLIGLAIWAAVALPMHFREQGLIDAFELRIARIEGGVRTLTTQAGEVTQQIEVAANESDSAAASQLLTNAAAAREAAATRLAAIAPELAAMPEPGAYVDDRDRWDERLAGLDGQLAEAIAQLGVARGLLDAVKELRTLRLRLDALLLRLAGLALSPAERTELDAATQSVEAAIAAGDRKSGEAALRSLGSRIDAVLAARQREAETRAQYAALATALAGVDVEPDAAAELQGLKTAVEQAMAAADWARAAQQVAKLRDLVQLLDSAYELRIVSRPDDRSGVWRIPDANPRGRNYYIIVEAIAADGKALTLPIESEEDQSTRSVRRFGIRVPESVFERVKADKLDNGLIDEVLFGVKRRGQKEPEYRFPVAGGRITRW